MNVMKKLISASEAKKINSAPDLVKHSTLLLHAFNPVLILHDTQVFVDLIDMQSQNS
jgi:hypothetical protein